MVVDADVDNVSLNPSSLKDHLKTPTLSEARACIRPPLVHIVRRASDLPQVAQSGVFIIDNGLLLRGGRMTVHLGCCRELCYE
jgi:hypothetical protein